MLGLRGQQARGPVGDRGRAVRLHRGLLVSLQCDSSLLRGPGSKGHQDVPSDHRAFVSPPPTPQPAQLRHGPGASFSFLRIPQTQWRRAAWTGGSSFLGASVRSPQAPRQPRAGGRARAGQPPRVSGPSQHTAGSQTRVNGAGDDTVSAVALCGVSVLPTAGVPGGPAHWLSASVSPSCTDTAAPPVTFSGAQGLFRAEGNASLVSHPSPGIHKSS